MRKQIYILLPVLITLLLLVSTPSSYAAKKSNANKAPQQQLQEEAAEEDEPKAPKSGLAVIAKSPYLGALVIDALTGKVLFEDKADTKGYPASIIKLMNLLIILDAVKAKQITLQDKIDVSAEVSKIGGSQVYLKEHEVFTVEELMYAMMIQSANDAACALALHLTGSKEAFVDLMNNKAREIGMKNTAFHSVHGLPPGKDQEPDVSTPRDIAMLCQELLKYPDAIQYTSAKERSFRSDSQDPFIMRNHNHLLRDFQGCDGFKTGYFRAGGFSIAATAAKKGVRAIAVIFGSADRKVRDAKARDLLSKGLTELVKNAPPLPASAPATQAPAVAAAVAKADNATGKSEVVQISKTTLKLAGAAIVAIIILLAAISFFKNTNRKGL